MAGALPGILWGPNLENVLQLTWPLDSVVTGRKPRDGSEWVQGASGIEDAWITGYDYEMTADWRWIDLSALSNPGPQTGWDGPVGVQAFLDWARQKNTFRFLPDNTNPLFYVDGCYLVDPLDSHGDLESDGTRKLRMTIRNPTVSFSQALRGLMFEYAPGASLTDPVAATFTRATAGTRRGNPANLAAAVGASDASGVLRDRHYEGTVRTTLLETSRTQLVTDPENFQAASWTAANAPTFTGGKADPFGGTSAFNISDTSATLRADDHCTVTFTGDGVKALAFFYQKGATAATNGSAFELFDATALADRLLSVLTWSGSTPAWNTTVGSLLANENWGGGWWRALFVTTSVTAANTNRLVIAPANTATDTGDLTVFGANAWNAAYPASYQGPSLTARNQDVLTSPHTYAPQAFFSYSKFKARFVAVSGQTIAILQLGDSGTVAPRAYVVFANGTYTSLLDNGTVTTQANLLAPTLWGDQVEVLQNVDNTGRCTVKVVINGGTETSNGPSGASALPAAWHAALVSYAIGAFSPDVGLIQTKVGPLNFGGRVIDSVAKAQAV